jgi:hypothetical protein
MPPVGDLRMSGLLSGRLRKEETLKYDILGHPNLFNDEVFSPKVSKNLLKFQTVHRLYLFFPILKSITYR